MQLLHACPTRALRSGSPSNVLHRSYWYASLHEGKVCTLVVSHCYSTTVYVQTLFINYRILCRYSGLATPSKTLCSCLAVYINCLSTGTPKHFHYHTISSNMTTFYTQCNHQHNTNPSSMSSLPFSLPLLIPLSLSTYASNTVAVIS